MNINTQNIIRQIIQHFDSKINTLSIKNIHEAQKEQDYYSFIKNLSADKKFTIISEKTDDKNSHKDELRFQTNTPIAQSLESSKFFNETKRVTNKSNKKYSNSFNYQEEESIEVKESNNEKGFYIIIDGVFYQPGNGVKELSYIQKRINKIYNIKFAKDPGTLVNVIA
ncbi:MAG: hypothetical protein N2249_08080 [Melioribacter sp.]|nr:hypothetical protein [Melioribacter sp.]